MARATISSSRTVSPSAASPSTVPFAPMVTSASPSAQATWTTSSAGPIQALQMQVVPPLHYYESWRKHAPGDPLTGVPPGIISSAPAPTRGGNWHDYLDALMAELNFLTLQLPHAGPPPYPTGGTTYGWCKNATYIAIKKVVTGHKVVWPGIEPVYGYVKVRKPDRYLCAWNQIRYQVGSVWGAKLRAAFVAAKQAGENPRTLKGGLRVALWHRLNDHRVAQSGSGGGPQQIPSADTIGNYLEEAMAKALSPPSVNVHLALMKLPQVRASVAPATPAPGKTETSSFQPTQPTARGPSAESTTVVGPSVQFDPRAVPGTGPAQPGWEQPGWEQPGVSNGMQFAPPAEPPPELIDGRVTFDQLKPVPPSGATLDLSVKRYALWGAYGAAILPVATTAWRLLAGKGTGRPYKKRR